MRFNRKILIAVGVVIILVTVVILFVSGLFSGKNQQVTLSGTIEATEIRLSTRNGGEVREVYASEGETVVQGEKLAWIANPGENISSPVNGVLLERLFEPGELAQPGNVMMVVADLSRLQLKVYAPEDRYGQFSLGQVYPVTVDSYPGITFNGKISHIAEQAEFTPRNVQTIDGRKSTVFAITLDIVDDSSARLIPGMPADVHFVIN